MSQSPLPKATTAFSVAFSIPARNRTCLASLPRRKLSTAHARSVPAPSDATNCAGIPTAGSRRRPGRTDLSGSAPLRSPPGRPTVNASTATAVAGSTTALKGTSRSEGHPGCSRTFFFSQQCFSHAVGCRSEPFFSLSTHAINHHHHHPPNRSFSTQSSAWSEWGQRKAQSLATTPRDSLSQPPWAALDTAYQRRKSPAISRTRVRRPTTFQRCHSSPSLSWNIHHPPNCPSGLPPLLRTTATRRRCTNNNLHSNNLMFADDTQFSVRSLHSTPRARRSSGFNQLSEQPIPFYEKRQAVAHLRQKIFYRASTLELWEAYGRLKSLQAVMLLHNDDLASMFELLAMSPRLEDAMDMMIRVTRDLEELDRPLPQAALDILLRQMVDQLPADQIKTTLLQLMGRGRFITGIMLTCESNAEMAHVLELHRKLRKNMHEVDSASTYYRDRKELAENLGKLLTGWIKTECLGRTTPPPLNSRTLEYLLTFMLDRGLYDEAYSTMVSLATQGGIRFSEGMYTTAINRFGLAERFDYMDMILERMKRQGLEPTINHYSALIDVYSKSGNLREAQKTYQEILAAGLTPTAATFGPMLEAVGKMGDFEMTKQLAEQMNASGVASNAYTLNALLKATLSDPDWSLEVFQDMTRDGTIEPNVVNYNMLLQAYRLQGDLDGALRIFRWWRIRNSHVRPNEWTLSTLLSLYADRGEVEGGESLWHEMVNVHGVQPNVYAYASKIHLYCTAEDMTSAHSVYREMIQIGFKPNLVVFGTLLNAYARYGDLTQMLSIYDVMRSEGLRPNSFIYANLLLGLVQDGDMTAARRLYANMEEDGFGDNVLAQTIMMRGYLQQGKRTEAFRMYNHMVRSGQVPNYMTYAILIHAHAKRKDTKVARGLIQRLLQARDLVELGDEHQALAEAMDSLASVKDDEEDGDGEEGHDGRDSHKVFAGARRTSPFDRATDEDQEDDEEEGDGFDDRVLGRAGQGQLTQTGTEGQQLKAYFKPSMLSLYPPLLDAYAKEGNVLASEDVFQELKARGLQPNTILYTMLMDSYRRAGLVDKVVQIWEQLSERYVEKLRQSGRQGSSESSSFLRNGRANAALVVEWGADQRTTKPHRLRRLMQHPISIVIDSLSYSGRIQEAMAIWQWLEREGVEFDSTNWNDYCIALARNGRLLQACHVMQHELLRGHMGITGARASSSSNSGGDGDVSSEQAEDRPKEGGVTPRGARRGGSGGDMGVDGSAVTRSTVKLTDPRGMPETLNFPRPRTFAALADALDQLLEGMVDYSTSSVSYIKESLRQDKARGPLASSSSTTTTTDPKELLQTMLDKKLETYPRPFEQLDLSQRNMLWEAVRSQYPEVLRAVCEGSLVARRSRGGEGGDTAGSSPSKLTWQGFRPWQGVSSYLRDYEGQPKNSNQRYSRSSTSKDS